MTAVSSNSHEASSHKLTDVKAEFQLQSSNHSVK